MERYKKKFNEADGNWEELKTLLQSKKSISSLDISINKGGLVHLDEPRVEIHNDYINFKSKNSIVVLSKHVFKKFNEKHNNRIEINFHGFDVDLIVF